MRRLPGLFFYVASFSLARGGLFLAPIVLANLLAPADYGVLELAQAIASMGTTILALGTSAAVPLVLVRKIGSASWGGILLHQFSAAALLLVLALAAWAENAAPVVWVAAACTGVLMLQALWSVTLKSRGRGEASLLLDAGFWGILGMTAALGLAFGVPLVARGQWVFAALFAYLSALITFTFWRFIQLPARSALPMYGPTIRTGFPLMTASLLALLATTSGRLGIGLLSSPEMTSQYAILFRATALPIVAHQIIIVAGFRQIFEMSEPALERRLQVIVALVTACVIGFWLFSDIAGLLLGPAFIKAFAQHRAAGLLILTQSIMWSAIALNDLANTRAQSALLVGRLTALYFAVVLPLAWWFLSLKPISLELFVPVHSVVMGGYFLTQVLAMTMFGIRLWRPWALAGGAFVTLSILTGLN